MSAVPIKRKALTMIEKLNVIKKVEANPNVTRAQLAKEFNMPVTTLNGIMAKKDVLFTRMGDVSSNVKRSRVRKYNKVEEKLLEWFKQATAVGIPIDGTVIRTKAVEIADCLNVKFKPSNGWIDRFRKRTGLVFRKTNRNTQNVNQTESERWKTEHLPHLIEGYRPCDIFNADECGLLYKLLPNKTYAFQGEKCHGGKLRKERITVLVTTNMDGSEKLPLLVIGKFEKPHCFKNIKSFPCIYKHNKMAWITCTLFEDFLKTLNAEMATKNRNILLFIDNCAAHPKNVAYLSNVHVEFLPPAVQPMEQGLIKILKHHFRKQLVGRMLQFIQVNSGAKNLDNFSLSVLDAMHFLADSWDMINAEIIRNCFRKAGFLEALNEENEISSQMEGVDNTAWKMLQRNLNFTCSFEDFVEVDDEVLTCGMMSINELCDESSEEDINETNEESTPIPTYCEIVKTVDTLQQFLQCVKDVPESVMKSVWEIDTFITGLAQKHMKQMILDSCFKKQATTNRTAFEPVEKKEALPSEPIVVSLNPADFNISDGFDGFETQFNKISDQDSSSGQEESQLKRPKKALSKISSEWPYALPELDDSLLPFLHGTCDEDDVHTLQNRFRKEIVTYLNKNNYICESNSALRRWGYDRLGRAIYEKYPNIQWTFYGSKSYNKKRPPNPWSFFIRTVSTLRKARRSRNLK